MSIRIFDPLAEPPPPAPHAPSAPGVLVPARAFSPASVSLPPPAPMDPAAFYGIAGDIVRKIEPHTEADPAALLVQFLVAVGNCIGRKPHFVVEATPHYTNEFCVICGQSAKARKGTSFNWISTVLEMVDPDWRAKCQAHGLVSGEGIIHHVRDDMPGKVPGEIIAGIADKRLLIVEEELGGPLAVSGRKDNTLTSVLRCAWDGKDLRTLAKNCHEIATAPHVSIIGHITFDELKARLRGDLLTNGFANRFLWVYARRARFLPDGGTLCAEDLRDEAEALRQIIETAREIGRVTRDPAASELWRAEYERLSAERSGTVGAVTSRLEAHAIRLSLIYALLDGSRLIRPEHLHAAFAVCQYGQRSAEYCFGGLSADAQAILEALHIRGAEGMVRTEISRMIFNGHAPAAQIEAALRELETAGLAHRSLEPTAGLPREVWRVTA